MSTKPKKGSTPRQGSNAERRPLARRPKGSDVVAAKKRRSDENQLQATPTIGIKAANERARQKLIEEAEKLMREERSPEPPLPRGFAVEAPTWLDEEHAGQLLVRALAEFDHLARESGQRRQIQIARAIKTLVAAAVLDDKTALGALEAEAVKQLEDMHQRLGQRVHLGDWDTWETPEPLDFDLRDGFATRSQRSGRSPASTIQHHVSRLAEELASLRLWLEARVCEHNQRVAERTPDLHDPVVRDMMDPDVIAAHASWLAVRFVDFVYGGPLLSALLPDRAQQRHDRLARNQATADVTEKYAERLLRDPRPDGELLAVAGFVALGVERHEADGLFDAKRKREERPKKGR